MRHLFVVRFSAMGDVAMTVPVIHSLAVARSDLAITFVSRPAFRPLFDGMPGNVAFISADLKGRHRGLWGIVRLFLDFRGDGVDAVADLHDVLRTKVLRLLFRFVGVPCAKIDKGRAEKRALTRAKGKVFRPLKSSFERYRDVFAALGISFPWAFNSVFDEIEPNRTRMAPVADWDTKGTDKWIGVAPFAKHPGKIYPLEQMERVVAELADRPHTRVFLFGGGLEEMEALSAWENRYAHVTSVPGRLRMDGEIVLMSRLDVMVSMDSANMHIASIVGTPVVSVWGATHPYCGFAGWRQSEDNFVQVDMSCRPCSVFGNKPCSRGDYACLAGITPDEIVEKVLRLIRL